MRIFCPHSESASFAVHLWVHQSAVADGALGGCGRRTQRLRLAARSLIAAVTPLSVLLAVASTVGYQIDDGANAGWRDRALTPVVLWRGAG